MKEIKAYIRNTMVDDVIDALKDVPGVSGVAIVPVNGFGHTYDDDRFERIEMTRLEANVPDAHAPAVIECIASHARTGDGHPGDGRIYVSELFESIRIADGQRE